MVRALLISATVGGVCGLLSCYMTLKGWALMGDAVSHSVLPGVILAYAIGLPFSVGAFVFGVGSVATIGFVKQKSRIKEDTVIGLVFTGFFALGLVLVSKTRSNIDLTHILFGNVLGISIADIQQTVLISALVTAVLLLFRRDLLLFCFDEISGAPRRESDESEIPDTRLSPLVLYESNGGLELEHDHANQLRTTNGGGRGARSAQGARPP